MKRFAQDWIQIRTEYLELCGLPLYLNAIRSPDGIVLLDSGVAATPETSLRGELREAGWRIEDIGLVVNSHAHPDHMGGNATLAAIAGPRFAAPAAEATWLEDNDRLIAELWNPNPDAYELCGADRIAVEQQLGRRVRIDQLLRDGDTVAAGGGSLTVITTSGHSPGHLALHDAARRVLFTFDDVQGRGLPIAHSDRWLAPLYHDVDRYLTGLRRLRELDFDSMVPAHGDHMERAAALARIEESIAFVERADTFVAECVASRRQATLRELAELVGTGLGPYGGVNLQTMSIAKAHLDRQVACGDLVPTWHVRTTDPPS
jgi:glyoxylase-like metal-dependent hydrolase (beta-lactamase superfamily II)